MGKVILFKTAETLHTMKKRKATNNKDETQVYNYLPIFRIICLAVQQQQTNKKKIALIFSCSFYFLCSQLVVFIFISQNVCIFIVSDERFKKKKTKAKNI